MDIAGAIANWGLATGRTFGGSAHDFALSHLGDFIAGTWPGGSERSVILSLIPSSGGGVVEELLVETPNGGEAVTSPYDYGGSGDGNGATVIGGHVDSGVEFLGPGGEYATVNPDVGIIDYATASQRFQEAGAGAIVALLPVAIAIGRSVGLKVLRLATNWKVLLGAEAVDLATPGIDLPSPTDIPGGALALLKEVFVDIPVSVGSQFFGLGGGGGGAPVGMHGNPVKSWTTPGGYRHWLYADGWTAHERKNGTIKWYKPPKPIVYVPGGRESRKTINALARIYKKGRNQAKDTYGLVDKKAPTPRKPDVIIQESGRGGVQVSR